MTAGSERLTLLEAYRAVAHQLVDLLAPADELIDIDALERLMSERDLLIQRCNELGGGPWNDEERVVAAEIQRLDAISTASMQGKLQQTREKSYGFQMQRRGHAAYAGDYAYDAAFIDKWK